MLWSIPQKDGSHFEKLWFDKLNSIKTQRILFKFSSKGNRFSRCKKTPRDEWIKKILSKEGTFRYLSFVVCFGQWWFLSNQITLFLDHLGKINLYIRFLGKVNHQGNLATGATSFGWLWLLVSLIQTDCRIPWSSISLEEINWCLRFFTRR